MAKIDSCMKFFCSVALCDVHNEWDSISGGSAYECIDFRHCTNYSITKWNYLLREISQTVYIRLALWKEPLTK